MCNQSNKEVIIRLLNMTALGNSQHVEAWCSQCTTNQTVNWAVHSAHMNLGYSGRRMHALTSFRNCCQNVFDQGSQSQLQWICSAADNKNLCGLGKESEMS